MSLSWLKVLSWCKFVTTEDGMVVGGCSDDVLYLWLNDCCLCSVKLLWMELIVVFSTMLLSNYFCLLLVWVGMEMVLYWFVPTWLYAVVSGDVAVVLRMLQCPLSSRCGWCRCTWGWLRGDIAVVVWTNVCCHVLLPHDVEWCCCRWYCIDVPP